MIVLVGGEKGGTGKTTIATNLAQMRSSSGKDVLLIDTDKQSSAASWAANREEEGITPRVNCIEKRGKNIAKDVLDLAKRYHDIIIDAGGRDSTELRSAMICADILIIPIQASQFDLWTLSTMEELVASAQLHNGSLKAYCVINRGSTNPTVSEVKQARELFKDLETITTSDIVLRERISYRRAVSEGKGVAELKPLDMKAANEMADLYHFIYA